MNRSIAAALALIITLPAFAKTTPVSTAFDLFSHCLKNAVSGNVVSEREFFDGYIAERDDSEKPASEFSLSVEIEDDFDCMVQTDAGDAAEFNDAIQTWRAEPPEFVGRCSYMPHFKGQVGVHLACNMKAKNALGDYHFQIDIANTARTGKFLWIRPILIFDNDGYARIPGAN